MTVFIEAEKIHVDTNVVADKTVGEIASMCHAINKEISRRGGRKAIRHGLPESIGIAQDVAIAALYVWKRIGRYNYTDDGWRLTVRELVDISDDTKKRFWHQHVINHAAYYVVQGFYDWLTDKNLIARFSKAEGYWRKLDAEFRTYEQRTVGQNEESSKTMFVDYVNQSFANVEPYIEPMEIAVRDYLIQHRASMVAAGQKDDIATLQKVAVCLHFLLAMQHHFADFFNIIENEHGVDLQADYRYADLQKMTLNFVFMCQAQGVKFRSSSVTDCSLLGIDVESSLRVRAAWDAIVDIVDDGELDDKTVEKAINMNKAVREKYQHVFDEVDAEREAKKQQEMAEAFKMLEDKYKVSAPTTNR